MKIIKNVRVHSNIDVVVTPNIKIQDLTDVNSMSPNKLRAVMDWDHEPVKITRGSNTYPAYIKEWNTVKGLVFSNTITIADIYEDAPDDTKEATQEPQTTALNKTAADEVAAKIKARKIEQENKGTYKL